MININNEENYKKLFDGVEIKTTVMGDDVLMTRFVMKKGAELPLHSHADYEQIGVLISGKIILTIGDDVSEFYPGDSWCIGKGVEHKAEIIENSVAVEVFSYPREDYVKLLDPVSR